ncbi:MAG: DNA mismatch repair endonuclease MutL [Rikenellaceae bacterium]
MSNRIKLLPPQIANQIAAGEVVNKPSSIVKEMVENAIDAGADTICVNFRQGGRDLIQIVDNGIGLSPEDARMAFERHATSKISSVEDLYSLQSFGFRGEALASIAAVAQVELHTRRRENQLGTETIIHGGEFCSQSEIPCKEGSEFLVRNLFYNVPARRKFMSKASTSAREIKTEFQRIALCYPDIRLELYSDDAPTYRLQPTSLIGRIVDVVGRSIRDKLLALNADTSIVKLRGYIGNPASAKKSKAEQYLYVNGRYFRSAKLSAAVLRGYEKLIQEGSNPSFFLFLDIAPDRIDVNVHPQKIEVKFADEDAVFQIINAAVRETLAKTGSVPMMSFDEAAPIEIPILRAGESYAEPKSSSQNDEYNPFAESYIDHTAPMPSEDFTGFDVPYNQAPQPQVTSLKDSGRATYEYFEAESLSSNMEMIEVESEAFTEPRTPFAESEFEIIASEGEQSAELFEPCITIDHPTKIGAYHASALIDGVLTIFDLKRAKERIAYNYYISNPSQGKHAPSQRLLFAESMEIENNNYAMLEDSIEDLRSMGFTIEFMGEGRIDIEGLPADVAAGSAAPLIEELLHSLATTDMQQSRTEALARVVARSAARSLAPPSIERAQEMISGLLSNPYSDITPYGRAISTRITIEEIKSRLG